MERFFKTFFCKEIIYFGFLVVSTVASEETNNRAGDFVTTETTSGSCERSTADRLGNLVGNVDAMFLGNWVANLIRNLDGNLLGNLVALLSWNIDAFLVRDLTVGGCALLPRHLGAPRHLDHLGHLDWDLSASLLVDCGALLFVGVGNLNTFLGGNILAALLVGGLVGGLLFIDALLLVDGSALLVGNLTVDLVALLLVHWVADLLVGGAVLRPIDGLARFSVRRLALGLVGGQVDRAAVDIVTDVVPPQRRLRDAGGGEKEEE